MMPKVSLTNKELEILCYYLDWKIMEINETGNEFEYPEIENIYSKLQEAKWTQLQNGTYKQEDN